jgi:hypothetical protein
MENHTFQFPILTIKAVRPLLSKGKIVFAHQILATTQDGITLSLYENRGLDLNIYVGDKMECLLEITKGEFYNSKGEIIPEDALKFTYQWQKRTYEFFPELVERRETLDEAGEEEEEAMQELFEAHSLKMLQNWGLNGIELDIFQAKPLLSSTNGFFLLNEYEFEEELEKLELNEQVNIKIDELFLRGVRPYACESEVDKKQKIIQSKSNTETIRPEEQMEVKEPKKRRIFFQ